MVRTHNDYRGRGPTRAQAFFHQHVVVVLMEDAMTTAERSLVKDGKSDFVLGMRRALESTMRADLVSAIEGLTGRKVVALMSANHTEPDYSAELFVLDGSVPGEPDAPGTS